MTAEKMLAIIKHHLYRAHHERNVNEKFEHPDALHRFMVAVADARVTAIQDIADEIEGTP